MSSQPKSKPHTPSSKGGKGSSSVSQPKTIKEFQNMCEKRMTEVKKDGLTYKKYAGWLQTSHESGMTITKLNHIVEEERKRVNQYERKRYWSQKGEEPPEPGQDQSTKTSSSTATGKKTVEVVDLTSPSPRNITDKQLSSSGTVSKQRSTTTATKSTNEKAQVPATHVDRHHKQHQNTDGVDWDLAIKSGSYFGLDKETNMYLNRYGNGPDGKR